MKDYLAGGIYHIYNRGVEKRTIFVDSEGYRVFRYYLASYLRPPNPAADQSQRLPRGLVLAGRDYDLYARVVLLAYCLMPNHFHLLVKQTDEDAMAELVRRLSNAYVGYFNKKHRRVGSLFQGTYRAVLVDKTEQLLHLTRYIHRNPAGILHQSGLTSLDRYLHSSYPDYLGIRMTPWVNPAEVLEHFGPARFGPWETYRDFVEEEVDADPQASRYQLD